MIAADSVSVVAHLRGVDCLRTAAALVCSSEQQQTHTRVAIPWTGGKDCYLALQRTLDTNGLQVVCLVSFCKPGHEFSAHRLEWQKLQAQALDIPFVKSILNLDFKNDNDYTLAYATAIGQLQQEYNIQYIVTGDVDYVGSGDTNFLQQNVCRGQYRDVCGGVQVLLPLWQQCRLDLLQEILDLDFDIIFSCVKSPYFDTTWIGQHLDYDAIQTMMTSNQRVQKEASAAVVAAAVQEDNSKINGDADVDTRNSTTNKLPRPHRPLDLSGENGEYHTMVLNGPMYRRHHNNYIQLINATSKELFNQPGQESGERWWVLDETKTRFILATQEQKQQEQQQQQDDVNADIKTRTTIT